MYLATMSVSSVTIFLEAKDVLDAGADLGTRAVVCGLLVSERSVTLNCFTDVAFIASVLWSFFRLLIAVGTINPYPWICRVRVDEVVSRQMPGCHAHSPGASRSLVLSINTAVVLVTKVAFAVLHRATPIHVFLGALANES